MPIANDLGRGGDAIDQILARLAGDALELADPYAEAVLETARSAAGSHPTPQSRMAASGLIAQRGAVIAPGGALVSGAGGRPASLAQIIAGAEYGSDTYTQFASRNPRGYWLFPAFDAASTVAAGDRALQAILESAT
jgi:hypothetical protein